MSALKLIECIEQGGTFQREFTVTDPDDGTPFDMTGFIIRANLKPISGDTQIAFDCTITTNKLLVELSDDKTAQLTPSVRPNYAAVIEAESPAGKVYRIAQISASVSAR